MTPKELAEKLTGIEYPVRIAKELIAQAKASNLVIVYGASDDLMEFEGAIYDEVGVFDGGSARITKSGVLQDFEQIQPRKLYCLLILPVSLAKGNVSSHPMRCNRVILG
jgi:hypothetical protein